MDEAQNGDESDYGLSDDSNPRRLLKLIFEITPVGVAVVKYPGLTFQVANPAYLKCLPDADLDPIDQKYADVWPPDDGFESLALVEKVIETGDDLDLDDHEQIYPDGNRRNFGLRLRRLPWGEALAVLIIIWEMTELAQAREQMGEMIRTREAELEAAVQECVEDMLALERNLFGSMEAKRKELSDRLHNTATQELYGVVFQLHSLQGELEQEAMVDALSSILARISQVNQVLRSIYNELWPTTLNSFGLSSAINGHLKNLQESYPEMAFRVDFATNGLSLAEELRVALFRIYQAGITNVVEHAEAKRVEIRFSMDDEIVLEIRDDGDGFRVPESWREFARNGQYGLLEAAERAKSLGGRLEVASEGGKGVSFRVLIPKGSEWSISE